MRLGEKIPYSSNRLCPSDLRNIQLEIDAMLELVRNYPDIDGIHFDNIRYSDSQACYCDGCKERFAKVLGTPLDNWPNCCVAKGKYYSKWIEFRCANINKVVETVQREARKINPKLKISAAVFTNYPMARINVGQDWKKWLDDGWVDFVCPMNYTSDNSTFRSQINKEIRWVGKSRLYPGMSAT